MLSVDLKSIDVLNPPRLLEIVITDVSEHLSYVLQMKQSKISL